MQHLALLPLLLLVGGQTPDIVRRAAGCWSVKLTAWQPYLDLKGDSGFIVAPRILRLEAVNVSPRVVTEWRVVEVLEDGREFDLFSYFRPSGADSILIHVARGLSGVNMTVAVHADSLRGKARTSWDFSREPQHAQATLVRMRCS